MRNIVLNLLIFLVSSCLCLLLAEGGLRAAQSLGWVSPLSRDSMDKGATPNRHLNARMRRADNPVLFMEYRPQDPNINNAGHRGPDFQHAKTPGTLRIALLGDSVGYGYSVPYDETFAARLADQLNRRAQTQYGLGVELYNFSVSGYSTAAEAELYRVRVRDYRPDFTLLAYVLNDPLPASMVVMSVGAARQQADRFQQLLGYSQLLAWVSIRWQQFMQVYVQKQNYRSLYQGELWQNTEQALAQLHADHTSDQTPLAAVIFPLLLDYRSYPFQPQHQQIAQTMQQLQIPSLDLLPLFSQYDALALRPHPRDDTHPNSQGHALAAQAIGDWLWPQLEPLLQAQAASGTPE